MFWKNKNPIVVNSGCEINDKSNFEIYKNKDGWSIYYDEIREHWVISEKIGTTLDLYDSSDLKKILEEYEYNNDIDQFEIITHSELNKLSNCYLLKNTDVLKKWRRYEVENDTYQSKIRLFDLILEVEDKHQFVSSEDKLNKFFNLYISHSSRLVDSNLYLKYTKNHRTDYKSHSIVNGTWKNR